jgi:hypothetical protein
MTLSRRLLIWTVVGGLLWGCTDGSTGTDAPPDANPPIDLPAPPPSSATYPNEPAGAVVLMDYDTDFSNLAGGPWDYISGSSNLSTASDASAPVNPSKVGRVRFAPGCCDGTGPARVETDRATPPAGWSRLYVSDWVKFDPAYQPHACCQKLFEFFWSSGGDKWLLVKADPTNGAFPLTPRFTTEYAGVAPNNHGGQPVIRPGVWYQYEVIVHRSGRLQLFIREQGKGSQVMYDGTPAGAGTVNPSILFWWWGYGGLGAYAGTVPGYIYHNHIRVSYTS